MNTYKKLLRYTPDKIHYAYLSILFSIVSTVLSIMPYWYFWEFLNELLVKQNFENSKYYAVLIVVLMLVNGVIYFFSLWFSHLLGFRLETNLRKEGIKHLMGGFFFFF